jgi:hypothetical protein
VIDMVPPGVRLGIVRQIAEEPFISAKTASVHVSNKYAAVDDTRPRTRPGRPSIRLARRGGLLMP